MPSLTRQLTVAAVAAVTAGACASPALAGARSSPATAVTARTPLVTAITAQTPKITIYYSTGRVHATPRLTPDDFPFTYQAGRFARVAAAVARIHADAAQRPAQLEWVLGLEMEANGDNALRDAQQRTVYGHPIAGDQALATSLADYGFADHYIDEADSRLGIAHRARTAEPFPRFAHEPSLPGPGTVRTPHGLAATVAQDDEVLREAVAGDVETTLVGTNEAAARDFSSAVAQMPAIAAQRPAQRDWVGGVQTQLRGDELLAEGERTHALPSLREAAIGNREMKDALGILRDASAEIAHADARLGVHPAGPSATIPSHITYYRG